MPKLPDVESLGNVAIPQSRQSIATNPGAGVVGQAVSGLGQTVAGVAEEKLAAMDRLQVETADGGLTAEEVKARQEAHANPDYVAAQAQYSTRMDAAKTHYAGLIRNNEERGRFDVRANETLARGQAEVAGIVHDKLVVAQKASLIQDLDNRHTAARDAPDEATRKAAIDGANASISLAQTAGLIDPVEGVTLRKGWVSDLGVDRVTSALNREDVPEAQRLMTEYGGMIDWRQRLGLEEHLKGVTDRRAAVSDADRAMGSATVNGPATFSYADPLHGAGRAPVPGGQFNAARDYGHHEGADIPAALGTPIYATGPGTAKVSHSALGGTIVTVDHGNGTVSKYDHLGKVNIQDGQQVTPDTVLGAVGVTGRTTGPHLHFEIIQNGQHVDPEGVIGQVQQSPTRVDLNGQLATIDHLADQENWTPERRDRAKAEVTRRVGVNDSLVTRQENDARDAGDNAIVKLGPDGLTNTSQIPQAAWANAAPEQRLTWMNKAAENAKALEAKTRDLNLYKAAIGTPGFTWNPFDDQQKKSVEAAVKTMGGTPDAALQVWQRTGILAKAGAVALRGGLVSTDPVHVQVAANVAGNMVRQNPNAFAGIEGGAEMEHAAFAFNHYTYDLGYSPQQAAVRVARENDPAHKQKIVAGQPQLDAWRKQIRKDGNVGLAAQALGGQFYSPSQAKEADDTYTELALDNMQHGNDLATAQALASAQMRKVYGKTRDGHITKYAPERGYPAINGSIDYVYHDAIETVKTETHTTPTEVHLVPIPGVTDQDFRRGAPPRYRLIYGHMVNGQKVLDSVHGQFAADVGSAASAARQKNAAAFVGERERSQRASARPYSSAIGTAPDTYDIGDNPQLTDIQRGIDSVDATDQRARQQNRQSEIDRAAQATRHPRRGADY